jgi:hypothetical protein
MSYFRITPGTQITATPTKPEFEIGEDVYVDVGFYIDGKELTIGGFYTTYCEVYMFGKKFTSGGDQKWSWVRTVESVFSDIRVHLGKATQAGIFDGYATPKAHIGV